MQIGQNCVILTMIQVPKLVPSMSLFNRLNPTTTPKVTWKPALSIVSDNPPLKSVAETNMTLNFLDP